MTGVPAAMEAPFRPQILLTDLLYAMHMPLLLLRLCTVKVSVPQ